MIDKSLVGFDDLLSEINLIKTNEDKVTENDIFIISVSISQSQSPADHLQIHLSFSTSANKENTNLLSLNVKADKIKSEKSIECYFFSKKQKNFVIILLNDQSISVSNIFISKEIQSEIKGIYHFYINSVSEFCEWYELVANQILDYQNLLRSNKEYYFEKVKYTRVSNSISPHSIYLENLYHKPLHYKVIFLQQDNNFQENGSSKNPQIIQQRLNDGNASLQSTGMSIDNEIPLETLKTNLNDISQDCPHDRKESNKNIFSETMISKVPQIEKTLRNETDPETLSKQRQERVCFLKGLKYKKELRGLVGLMNPKFHCYITRNVILQSLFNAPLFAHYFIEKLHQNEKGLKNKGILSYTFGKMIERVALCYDGKMSKDISLDLEVLKCALRFYISEEIDKTFDRGQHDAIHFLKSLLTGLSDELNRIVEKPPYKQLSSDLENTDIQSKSDEWFGYMLSNENSIVTDLFCGQIMILSTCTNNNCSQKSATFDNYWDLSLSFKGKTPGDYHELETLIRDNIEGQVLTNETIKCEKCGHNATQKSQIWRLPEILVITFRRFRKNNDWEKLIDDIKVPVKNLDLSAFVKGSRKSINYLSFTFKRRKVNLKSKIQAIWDCCTLWHP